MLALSLALPALDSVALLLADSFSAFRTPTITAIARAKSTATQGRDTTQRLSRALLLLLWMPLVIFRRRFLFLLGSNREEPIAWKARDEEAC